MTNERWRKIKGLYETAQSLDAGERSALLNRACAGDDALRAEIESLLKYQEESERFLETPTVKQTPQPGPEARNFELPSGQLSHFQIISLLGSGGMGRVYLTRDTRLDRMVALKILPPDFALDQYRMQRFMREAKAACALKHDNVATIYDVGEAEGISFIVMEHVEGQTLAEKISGRPMEAEEILDIGMQVADALDAAHSKGITHRDIKPPNLMITPRGRVKVLDFGLAKIAPAALGGPDPDRSATEETLPGLLMGTVQYMSPEQILGREVDHRSDIFSLGVTLYEMATGVLPFSGRTTTETMDKILHAQPEPPENFNERLPAGLDLVISKCLEKNPEQRYQSARELFTDLQNLKHDRKLRPLDAGLPTTRRFSLKRFKWLPLVAVLLALAVVSVILLMRGGQQAPLLNFAARDWILITDFDNRTNDPVFDTSLDTAFGVSIEQSRYANVLPRSRITAALKRMKNDPTERIGEAVGQELGLREGVRAIVVPSIAGVGDRYNLSASIRDPSTGVNVGAESVEATSKAKVLAAVNQLAGRVRQKLGESLQQITQTSKPEAVTTSSLEALQQYSLGIQKHRESKFREARTYYSNALSIDPQFTAAKASLGMIDFEDFDQQEGKKLLAEALEHLEGVTDRERYGIMAFHARAVENNLLKAIDYMKVLSNLYPDNATAFNNLGWFYYQLGRYQEAVDAYKQVLRIDPYFMLSYDILNLIYIHQWADLDAALALSRSQISYDPGHAEALGNMGLAYAGKGDFNAAADAFKKALDLQPDDSVMRTWLGDVYRIQGQYPQAIETLRVIPRMGEFAGSGGREEPDFAWYYHIAVSYQANGDTLRARQNFQRFSKEVERRLAQQPNNAELLFDMAAVLIRLGENQRGRTLADRALEIDPRKQFEYARVLNVQGKTDEALNHLANAIKEGFRDFVLMAMHPDFNGLSGDPRFRALMKR